MNCVNCLKEIDSNKSWSVELIVYNSDLEPWGNELHQDVLCADCAKEAKIKFGE